jgi:hypothetical protein
MDEELVVRASWQKRRDGRELLRMCVVMIKLYPAAGLRAKFAAVCDHWRPQHDQRSEE